MSNVKDIFPVLADPNLVKAHIKTKEISNAESLLRFSLVFNDLSLMSYKGGDKLSVMWLQNKWFERNFGVPAASIKVSLERMKYLGIDPESSSISPAFIFPSGDDVNSMVKQLRPFIERKKLLIQPDRSLFLLRVDESGKRTWESVEVAQFSPIEHWEIIDERTSRPIPLQFESDDSLNQKILFEITIPYLDGVNFSDLAKILDDEGDLISGLKASIKEAIKEVSNDVDPKILVRDVINPKVDILNRKFKLAINSHAFKVAGAAVGTVVLAYTAVTSAGISSAIATVCGSGGVGLLGKEYSSYLEKVNKLKEDPYYFLWRCKKLSNKT